MRVDSFSWDGFLQKFGVLSLLYSLNNGTPSVPISVKGFGVRGSKDLLLTIGI